MGATISDKQQRIAAAAGVFPDWLKRKTDLNWLDLCYRLVTAGVVVLMDCGPKVVPNLTGEKFLEHGADIATLMHT